MAHATLTSSSTNPSIHGRALQDTTNARSSQITDTTGEVLNEVFGEDTKAVAETEEDSESPPGSTGSSAKLDAVNSSPIGSIEGDTPPAEPSPLELLLSCERFSDQVSPLKSTEGSPTSQEAIYFSPGAPAEDNKPHSESLSSPGDIPDLTLPKSAAISVKEDAADSVPTFLAETTALRPDPSSLEVPPSLKYPSHDPSLLPATNNISPQSSSDQPYSPPDTLPDLLSLTLQKSENLSSQELPYNSSIPSDADDADDELSDSPTSSSTSDTRKEYFNTLVDYTHTQEIIEDARKHNRRWPTQKPIGPDGEESSDDKFSAENQSTTSGNFSISRIRHYIFLDKSGKLVDITTPPPLGILPVVHLWTLKKLGNMLAKELATDERANKFARSEMWNTYPGVDLNRDWQRLYYSTAEFYLADRPRLVREREVMEQEKRVRICESFSRFSWKRQHVPLSFDPTWSIAKTFAFCFRGDYDIHSGWSREPGSWWNARKRLFPLPTRLPFIEAVEAEARHINSKINLGWENSESYQPLRLRKRLHTDSAFKIEDFVELRAFQIETKGIIKLEDFEILTKEVPNLRGRLGQHSPSLPKFQKLRQVHREKFISEKWRQRRRVLTGWRADLTVIEVWRQRRRAQEKKAGRWTDGTVRMNRMWEEYHWVCDDEGIMSAIQQPVPSGDVFAEDWFEERWAWLV